MGRTRHRNGEFLKFLEALESAPAVGILRRVAMSKAIAAAEAAAEGGLRVIEITMDGADAEEQIGQLQQVLGSGVLVGAGTVTTRERFSRAVAAGAQFIVSPGFDAEIVDLARAADLPVIPGALTPTEVLTAWRGGATIVKLFPVGPLGAGYVRTLLEPLSEVPVMCNGLVTVEDAPGFLAAGASAVGMGATLFGDLEPAGVRSRTVALLEDLRGGAAPTP